MTLLVYDGSFEGWLTAVFEAYEYKLQDPRFERGPVYNLPVFNRQHLVHTHREKASRVWAGLQKATSVQAVHTLYRAFLSELPRIDQTLFSYAQYAFARTGRSVETDYGHPAVLTVIQTERKVAREKHRMEAFVRFQLTRDGLFYSLVEPDYNVLPLIRRHFQKRYADQRWLIYDAKRKYGLYYNLHQVAEVQLNFEANPQNTAALVSIYSEDEALYQQLWQKYFHSVNIGARKNTRLHLQHMPRRYWKYLPEKHPGR